MGLLGEHRNTSFTVGVAALRSSAVQSKSKAARRAAAARSMTRGALDARGHGVHAEGGRADEHRVLAGAAVAADQQVDGLIAAAAGEQHRAGSTP